jgi:cation-transporting ATPase E
VVPFPFLPRQLTLISAFTIGIPSVFLALGRSFMPSRRPFLRRVLAFALPTGLVAGAATFTAYALAVSEPDMSVSEERTLATLVMAAIGIWVLARLASPLTNSRRALVAAMGAGLAGVLAIPAARSFFELDFPRPMAILAAIGIVSVALAGLELGSRAVEALRTRRRLI